MEMIDWTQKVDSRRWSTQRRYDEYKFLCRFEPDLWHLLESARTIGAVCKMNRKNPVGLDDIWYHGGLRDRVIELVGHSALRTTDARLSGMRAYDIVYETVIDILYDPSLFDHVDKPEPKFTIHSASDLVNGVFVESRRSGDDLILTNWFNEDASR